MRVCFKIMLKSFILLGQFQTGACNHSYNLWQPAQLMRIPSQGYCESSIINWHCLLISVIHANLCLKTPMLISSSWQEIQLSATLPTLCVNDTSLSHVYSSVACYKRHMHACRKFFKRPWQRIVEKIQISFCVLHLLPSNKKLKHIPKM